MKWCWLCQLSHQAWQAKGHPLGRRWLLTELKAIAATLGGAKSNKGVKMHPMLDCVEICRYVIPVLHIALGLINRLLKSLLDYINQTLEEVPEDVELARNELLEATYEFEEAKRTQAEWAHQNATELSQLRIQRKLLIEWLKSDEYSREEKKEMDIARKQLAV